MDGSLTYVADPMCAWCWGFAPVLAALREEFQVEVRLVLGGLAADCDDPMPAATRAYVQAAWRRVAEVCGVALNHDFWTRCEPRRSTWPACRAVLAAEACRPGAGWPMFAAVQRAYYLEARNPSLEETLIELAAELDPALPRAAFACALQAPETRARLAADLARARELGVEGFPSLVAHAPGGDVVVTRGYAPVRRVAATLVSLGIPARASE